MKSFHASKQGFKANRAKEYTRVIQKNPEKAASLSQKKYCKISIMLKKNASFT